MKARLTDRWIYIIAVINSLLLISIWGVEYAGDSYSYLKSWDDSWSKGIMDEFRTPIYPVFLGILKIVFGKHFDIICIILQHCIFIYSIKYFKRILSLKVRSQKVIWWLTLAYVLLPSTSSWANLLLTETFAIVGIVFLFYNIFQFQHNAKLINVCWSVFWFAFLIFLRPASLYLFPAILFAWLLFFKQHKRMATLGFIGICIVGLFEIEYCEKFKERYGIFAPSSVSTINYSWIAFQEGLMDPSFTNDTTYASFIKKYNGRKIPAQKVVKHFGVITVHNSITASQRSLPIKWISTSFMRFYYASSTWFLAAYSGYGPLTHLFGVSICTLNLFLLIYIILLVWKMKKCHNLYRASLIMWITCVGNLILVVIGAPEEWGRLLIPSLPLTIIMFGQALNYIKFNFRKFLTYSVSGVK